MPQPADLAVTSLEATADEELARFFKLAVELDAPLTMFSEFVDKRWHDKIEDGSIDTFTLGACGTTLGHIESGENRRIVTVEWIKEYESRYGDLPTVWFMTEDGEFIADAYDDYRATHEVVASWTCSPSSGSSADFAPKG